MILRLPGGGRMEAYWLDNSRWLWRPRLRSEPGFSWLYWGRFALGWPGRMKARKKATYREKRQKAGSAFPLSPIRHS